MCKTYCVFPLLERCSRESGYVYSKIFNSCYKLHPENASLSYADYSPICGNEGGELMKIDSEKKQQHIADFLGLYFLKRKLVSISFWFFSPV